MANSKHSFWQQPGIYSRVGTVFEDRRLLLLAPHRNIIALAAHYTLGDISGGQDPVEAGDQFLLPSCMD